MAEFQLERLLRHLTGRGIDFVVIGGIAAALLGSAHDTFDLDICPATDSENLDQLGSALLELDVRLRGIEESVPFVPDGASLARMEILTLETSAGPLDVLMRPEGGPPYAQLRRRAERKDLGGFQVLVAGVDDLIAMKSSAGRPKDLIVVEELEAIKRLRRRLGKDG
jgi:predicted nucleotidyltransferase